MIKIYLMPLWKLCVAAGCGLIVWYAMLKFSVKSSERKKWFCIASMFMTVLAVYGILNYTVLHRSTSDTHQFLMVNGYNSEFFREMFMNALLYIPFGLTLSVFLGPWVILVAFLLSVVIETWQYVAGAGLAQGTDVLMNTLGAAIGAVPVWLSKRK